MGKISKQLEFAGNIIIFNRVALFLRKQVKMRFYQPYIEYRPCILGASELLEISNEIYTDIKKAWKKAKELSEEIISEFNDPDDVEIKLVNIKTLEYNESEEK